jgi:hypothetical protein
VGYGRSILWGAAAAVIVVVLAVAGVVFVLPRVHTPMTVPGDRLLVVVASRSGTDGSQVAQLMGVLDLHGTGVEVSLVDPLTTVTVPGTTYDRLRDAYPFGGGAAVSKAYASHGHEDPLPVVSFDEKALAEVVDHAGGATATLPAAVNVFDGTRLFTFGAGAQKLKGADVVALLSSTDFAASAAVRASMRLTVARGLADALSRSQPDFAGLLQTGHIRSTLRPHDLAAVADRIRERAGSVTVRTGQ